MSRILFTGEGCLVWGGAWSRGVCSQGGLPPGGEHLLQGGAWSGGSAPRGGAWSGGLPGPGGLGCLVPGGVTAAGGTHPTGMHSCSLMESRCSESATSTWTEITCDPTPSHFNYSPLTSTLKYNFTLRYAYTKRKRS